MENSKNFWDRWARFYARLQERNAKNLYKILAELIAPQLHPNMNVLELGCGTGQLSLPLAPFVKEWIATDFSPNMIAELTKRNIPSNLYPVVQDATDLPYTQEQFDAVVIANTLHIMPQPEKALQEAYRVVKKDGLLIAPTFVKDEYQNSWKIWVMKQFGFQIYNNWSAEELGLFVSQFNFLIEKMQLIPSSLANECLLIARR